jgi:hypothetical protein
MKDPPAIRAGGGPRWPLPCLAALLAFRTQALA